ncbi:MAG: hypothetical protein ABII18_05730 [bacterium]|nr:hypothetical protein [bacterium]MBU1919171.1 hypothetical protein [bacterium]
MIIWRGWGILALVIPAITWIIIPLIFKELVSHETYSVYYRYSSAFGIFLGAIPLWFLGRKLNRGGARTLVDEKTGEKVVLQANHSFFFIKMEYWSILFILFSLFVVLS